MPYPFAHPAAVLPLGRVLGRLAVPSALALGSLSPDFWYLVPGLERADSHSLAGLFAFCLPAGLLAYVAYHLVIKQPLIELLPTHVAARLSRFAAQKLPAVSWPAVIVSLVAGACTHLAWDAAVHGYEYGGLQVAQHASTALGTAIVLAWSSRWLRRAPETPVGRRLPEAAAWRAAIVGTFLVVLGTSAFLQSANASPIGLDAVRDALREAAVAATWTAGSVFLAYCLLYRLRR